MQSLKEQQQEAGLHFKSYRKSVTTISSEWLRNKASKRDYSTFIQIYTLVARQRIFTKEKKQTADNARWILFFPSTRMLIIYRNADLRTLRLRGGWLPDTVLHRRCRRRPTRRRPRPGRRRRRRRRSPRCTCGTCDGVQDSLLMLCSAIDGLESARAGHFRYFLFFCIFYKVNNLFLEAPVLFKNPLQLDKKFKNNFLLLKKFKNSESAQLWTRQPDETRSSDFNSR